MSASADCDLPRETLRNGAQLTLPITRRAEGVPFRKAPRPWLSIVADRRGSIKAGDDDGPTAQAFVDDAARLERLREVIRLRHYARSTEETYLHWNRRFLAYRHDTEAEGEPTAADAKAFLTHLAMVEKVSASTQNQAFSALLLLFREVLRVDLEEMAQTVRAKRGPKLPTVLSVAEVQRLLSAVEPTFQLMVKLLYGSGLRLGELLRLRVKDLDFDAGLVVVRSGKGDKDRATLLPVTLPRSSTPIWRKCASGTRWALPTDMVKPRCPTPWRASTPTLGGSGAGSTSSPPTRWRSIRRTVRRAGITSTIRICRRRSAGRRERQG